MFRILTIALALIAVLSPIHAQGPQPAASQTLHISRCSVTTLGTSALFLNVFGTINGQKVELQSAKRANGLTNFRPTLLEPGDYPIRIVVDERKDDGIQRSYEIQLRDGKQATYELVGLSE